MKCKCGGKMSYVKHQCSKGCCKSAKWECGSCEAQLYAPLLADDALPEYLAVKAEKEGAKVGTGSA